jgi:3-deoxy-D-manno-octulosonic-acid transferase
MNIDASTLAIAGFIGQEILNGGLQEVGKKILEPVYNKITNIFHKNNINTKTLSDKELTNKIIDLITTNQELQNEVELIKQNKQAMQIITNIDNSTKNISNTTKTYNDNSKDLSGSTFNGTVTCN